LPSTISVSNWLIGMDEPKPFYTYHFRHRRFLNSLYSLVCDQYGFYP
jgi:hypothetical protein